ncbi:MAG: protein kinase [Sedimentisphaerales bacterium]|nr:protein kinase [Sedimentisphaerales bacterium]
MAKEHINEEEIFKKAIQLANRDEQASYVKETCGSDKELLIAVETLLKHHYSNSILDSPALGAGLFNENNAISEGPGTIIGRYKLLEKIGEGGMAVVYMAEQQEPIRRKVALKIIKLGMDTKQVIARFEAERQALAIMDHPNIAKVFDAGATETGRPYFVMELVTGVSITEYCDKNNLSTKERLALFIQICNAVQHAHQKGIIHRDIKPSNVMVTNRDGTPVPKIIDFGIAKATNQRLTEKTLFTRYAHIIGTPAYMSPEQAELSELGIDNRSDIYSLGVLLYELLTGTPPFSDEQLHKASYSEMQRIIREDEPIRPSNKLNTLGPTLTDVAKHRGCTPDLLTKTIRGDLDWIVMKSLEKNRTQRYEAAEGLALDIQRHLEHRPVMAHAPSTGYRLHKFLRRNRLQMSVAMAAVVLVGTIVGLLVWNRYQIRLAEAEGARQVKAVSEARKLFAKGDLVATRNILRPLLESKHVGLEARNLYAKTLYNGHDPDGADKKIEAIMENHYRERIKYYTKKIAANPEDTNNYLQRAQQYHYLHEDGNVYTDMSRYATIVTGFDSKSTPAIFNFGEPVHIEPVIPPSPIFDAIECFSYDGLEMYISTRDRPGGYGDVDLWVLRRASTNEDWGPPENLGSNVNSSSEDSFSSLSNDGLTLYFNSNRPGGYGGFDLYKTMRLTTDAPWSPAENLSSVINSYSGDGDPWISADNRELYFMSERTGGYGSGDFYVAKRMTTSDQWSEPVNLGSVVNSKYGEYFLSLSLDGLVLLFCDHSRATVSRPYGYGGPDMWMSRRATTNDDWQSPVNLGPVVNGSGVDVVPRISPDGSWLYFLRKNQDGTSHIWRAPIFPFGEFEENNTTEVDRSSRENTDRKEIFTE